MRRHASHKVRFRASSGAGFTLIELLIVLGLMTAMVTIAVIVVVSNSITQARIAATKATLLKIDGLLQQRLEAFRMFMETPHGRARLQSKLSAKQQELQTLGISNPPSRFVELLVYKDLFKAAFPQTADDNLTALPGNAANAAESAELLYWMLTQADVFGVPPVDDSEFSASEVGDTDGDDRKEFVDAWGQPLRFYRWPTRLIRPDGPGTAINRPLASLLIAGLPSPPTQTGDVDPLAFDPDDRIGLYNNQLTPQQYENLVHTPDTYHVPLVVSAGPDKDLGLAEPHDKSSGGYWARPTSQAMSDPLNSALNDNLTNRQKHK